MHSFTHTATHTTHTVIPRPEWRCAASCHQIVPVDGGEERLSLELIQASDCVCGRECVCVCVCETERERKSDMLYRLTLHTSCTHYTLNVPAPSLFLGFLSSSPLHVCVCLCMRAVKYIDYNPHYTTLHHTTLHKTTLHYTTLHSTTLYYTTPHHTTLYYTTLRRTTPHHHTTPHHTSLYLRIRTAPGERYSGNWSLAYIMSLYICVCEMCECMCECECECICECTCECECECMCECVSVCVSVYVKGV
jgi:hypothetical protein